MALGTMFKIVCRHKHMKKAKFQLKTCLDFFLTKNWDFFPLFPLFLPRLFLSRTSSEAVAAVTKGPRSLKLVFQHEL